MVGLFAITELTSMIIEGGTVAKAGKLEGSVWEGFWGTFKYPFVLIQSTLVGAFIGVIPGLGATASNFLAYGIAMCSSKHPERYGKGTPEGVIAPEASNNSCIPTGLIPALTLGIPGGATALPMTVLCKPATLGMRSGSLAFQTGLTKIPQGAIAGSPDVFGGVMA
jgi:putative tricarboxylic transport membrane protein